MTPQEIARHGSERTAQAAAGRHVLAIQDTNELDFSAHALRTSGLGTISSRKGRGLFIHPVLAIDAESNACLGVAHQVAWIRHVGAPRKPDKRPIEQKESMHWVQEAQAAGRCPPQRVDTRRGKTRSHHHAA